MSELDLDAVKANHNRATEAGQAPFDEEWVTNLQLAKASSYADIIPLIKEVEALRARLSTIRSMAQSVLFNLRQGVSMDQEQLIRLLEDIEATTLALCYRVYKRHDHTFNPNENETEE
jgi:hypothetical protein